MTQIQRWKDSDRSVGNLAKDRETESGAREHVPDIPAESHPSNPRKRRVDYRAEPQGKCAFQDIMQFLLSFETNFTSPFVKGCQGRSFYRKCIKRIWGETRTLADGVFQASPGEKLWGAECLGIGSTSEGCVCMRVRTHTGTHIHTCMHTHRPTAPTSQVAHSLVSLMYAEMLGKVLSSHRPDALPH